MKTTFRFTRNSWLLNRILFLSFGFLFFACDSPNRQLVVNFENSAGINSSSEVICNNQRIGRVTDLDLVTNPEPSVNIHISLDIEGLPKDSRFVIREKDLLNTAIYVVKGKSNNYLSRSSKINGKIETLDYLRIRHL